MIWVYWVRIGVRRAQVEESVDDFEIMYVDSSENSSAPVKKG